MRNVHDVTESRVPSSSAETERRLRLARTCSIPVGLSNSHLTNCDANLFARHIYRCPAKRRGTHTDCRCTSLGCSTCYSAGDVEKGPAVGSNFIRASFGWGRMSSRAPAHLGALRMYSCAVRARHAPPESRASNPLRRVPVSGLTVINIYGKGGSQYVSSRY